MMTKTYRLIVMNILLLVSSNARASEISPVDLTTSTVLTAVYDLLCSSKISLPIKNKCSIVKPFPNLFDQSSCNCLKTIVNGVKGALDDIRAPAVVSMLRAVFDPLPEELTKELNPKQKKEVDLLLQALNSLTLKIVPAIAEFLKSTEDLLNNFNCANASSFGRSMSDMMTNLTVAIGSLEKLILDAQLNELGPHGTGKIRNKLLERSKGFENSIKKALTNLNVVLGIATCISAICDNLPKLVNQIGGLCDDLKRIRPVAPPSNPAGTTTGAAEGFVCAQRITNGAYRNYQNKCSQCCTEALSRARGSNLTISPADPLEFMTSCGLACGSNQGALPNPQSR